METIVIGTDGSETANRAVEEAAQLAGAVGARLHVVTAYAPIQSERFPSDARADSILDSACAAARLAGAEAEPHARKGDPAAAILEVADEQRADLVVVGNRGMRGGKRFLLGSVPNKVSHHAQCSVMIVRTSPNAR
jgi:nucleotide-binding universal stress UspA family protein